MGDAVETEPTRIALAVLELPDGRLVFQRRDGGAPVSPHLLGLFGGHVEAGESSAEAMSRELEEETSLQAADCDLRHALDLDLPATGRPGNRIAVAVFTGRAAHADFDVFEGDGAEVYARDEVLLRDDLAPSVRAVLLELADGGADGGNPGHPRVL